MRTLWRFSKNSENYAVNFLLSKAAHISFYSRDEVVEKKGEMVKIVNSIIGIVAAPGGGP